MRKCEQSTLSVMKIGPNSTLDFFNSASVEALQILVGLFNLLTKIGTNPFGLVTTAT